MPHIRGSCPKTELHRNNIHHKVLTTLPNILRAKNLERHEGVHCIALRKEATQNRRADIIVIDRRRGLIWTPRFDGERTMNSKTSTCTKRKEIYTYHAYPVWVISTELKSVKYSGYGSAHAEPHRNSCSTSPKTSIYSEAISQKYVFLCYKTH